MVKTVDPETVRRYVDSTTPQRPIEEATGIKGIDTKLAVADYEMLLKERNASPELIFNFRAQIKYGLIEFHSYMDEDTPVFFSTPKGSHCFYLLYDSTPPNFLS